MAGSDPVQLQQDRLNHERNIHATLDEYLGKVACALGGVQTMVEDAQDFMTRYPTCAEKHTPMADADERMRTLLDEVVWMRKAIGYVLHCNEEAVVELLMRSHSIGGRDIQVCCFKTDCKHYKQRENQQDIKDTAPTAAPRPVRKPLETIPLFPSCSCPLGGSIPETSPSPPVPRSSLLRVDVQQGPDDVLQAEAALPPLFGHVSPPQSFWSCALPATRSTI